MEPKRDENGTTELRHGRASDLLRGRGRGYSTRNVAFALIAIVAVLATTAIAALSSGPIATEHVSAITLSFGSNPVSNSLTVQFSRVSYIDQPTEYNTSAFTGGNLAGNGAFIVNSSGYGIYQFNSTTGAVASSNWAVAASLGSNVSYIFTDQRVALNGTGGTWTYEISEGSQTSSPPTSGNVSNGAAGATQNAIWVQSSYATGNYTFTVGDFQEKPGGYQTYTSTSVPSTGKIARLVFFELYVYMTKTQTVVSIVNTTNSVVLGSVTVSPVLDGNLSKVAYLTDQITMASSTNFAEIVDKTYLVDHNAFSAVPGAQGAFIPLFAGTSVASDSPFDPGSAKLVNASQNPTASSSTASVNSSLSRFTSITNSSNPGAENSALVNVTNIVNSTSLVSSASAKQAIATIRSAPESPLTVTTGTLYANSWTPGSVESQVWAQLLSTISGSTGIPTADIEIQGYLVSNVEVTTTLSSQASTTIQQYLDSSIPGMLSTSHIALVNQSTGAVDGGADIGDFLSASGTVYVPHAAGAYGTGIFDPVNGKTYASAEAAGFPTGSTVTSSGAISVPGQAPFLGFAANDVPQFGAGGCFVTCLGGLSGAALSVQQFLGSARTSEANAVGTVTNAVSSDVLQPVTSKLSTDLVTFSANFSKLAQNVLPLSGAVLGTVGPSISSCFIVCLPSLGSVASSIGSAVSSAAGAVASGVSSFTNSVSNIGGAIGSAVSNAVSGTGAAIASGAQTITNTVGGAVRTASAVVSPFFAQAGNDVISGLASTGRSLASLGSSIASAGMGALDSVGHAITSAAGGAWSWISNGFGAVGSDLMNAFSGIFGGGGTNPFSWLTSLGGSLSIVVVIVIIVVIVAIAALVLWMVIRRRRRKRSGHQLGAKSANGSSRKGHKFHRSHAGHRRASTRSAGA